MHTVSLLTINIALAGNFSQVLKQMFLEAFLHISYVSRPLRNITSS